MIKPPIEFHRSRTFPWKGEGPPPDRVENPRGTAIRTLVINDGLKLLKGISRFLLAKPEIDLAGVTQDIEEAVQEAADSPPHVVVMGLQSGRRRTSAMIGHLHRAFPAAGIIVTGHAGDPETDKLRRTFEIDRFIPTRRFRYDLMPAIHQAIAQNQESGGRVRKEGMNRLEPGSSSDSVESPSPGFVLPKGVPRNLHTDAPANREAQGIIHGPALHDSGQ